jgi:hypothetical protein
MLATTTAGTWGITGAQFLWGYGALCSATAGGVWQAYHRTYGPPASPIEPLPELSVCQTGVLNDGPDCSGSSALVTSLGVLRILAGEYAGPDGALTLTGADGGLTADSPGLPPLRLLAIDNTTFFINPITRSSRSNSRLAAG